MSDWGHSYYHYDGIGSVTNVTSSTGTPQWSYSYEPFGESRAALKVDPLAPDNPMRFTGEYQDATGLNHLRTRQYDPEIGQFTATDPWPARLLDPAVSSYIYVGDRPTSDTDPSGMVPLSAEGAKVLPTEQLPPHIPFVNFIPYDDPSDPEISPTQEPDVEFCDNGVVRWARGVTSVADPVGFVTFSASQGSQKFMQKMTNVVLKGVPKLISKLSLVSSGVGTTVDVLCKIAS